MRQARLLHQGHVLTEAIDKVGCHCRAVAVVPDVTIVLVPEIDPRILTRLLPLQPSVCRADAAAPSIKSGGMVICFMLILSSCVIGGLLQCGLICAA